MEASHRQQDIINVWRTEDCNILINAVAGSGKTSTLELLLEECEHRTLFLAFNKSIKEEMESRIEAKGLIQGKAMTMHALGLKAINGKYNKSYIKNGKNYNLLKIIQDKYKSVFKSLAWADQLKLGYSLMDMNDMSRLFLTNDVDEIKEHLCTMDKTVYFHRDLSTLWESFVEVREETYSRPYVVVDFIDMIYLPIHKNLDIPISPYYLMIDEAQDLNLCQHKLIDKLLSQGTVKKWIAVGDRNQAIYGFSGASSSSFDMFALRENVKELPLDICYRCATNIIDATNEVYNIMEYGTADSGIVEITDNYVTIKQNSMVICRNTGPLIDLFFKLLSSKKRAYIKGDDILGSIVRFLRPYMNKTTFLTKREILYKLEDLEKIKTDEGRIAYFLFRENFTNFKLLYDNLCQGDETIKQLLEELKHLFEIQDNSIMLCTIHKSKGLEADVVYILNENLIPSKFAKSGEQLTQEQNLKYVARSRAKKELYYLNI